MEYYQNTNFNLIHFILFKIYHQVITRNVEFPEFMLTKCQEDENSLKQIVWTDKAKFTKNVLFNKHNSHHWCDANHYVASEKQSRSGAVLMFLCDQKLCSSVREII